MAIPFPEVPFKSCRPISQDALKKAGCFTTLEVYLNIADDHANAGSVRATDDYARAFDLERTGLCPALLSPGGNMCSLAYPEVLPERMELVAYTTELGFLHDDYTEAESIASSASAHKRLDYALDPHSKENPDGSTSSLLMKKIFSAVVLECLDIDVDSGLDMLKSYSEQWLEVVDEHPIPCFSTLDEYLEHRIKDSGALRIWHGVRLSEADYNMMEPLFKAALRPTVLSNDFFSWEKERNQPRDRITNATAFYMSTGMTEQDARDRAKQDILDLESVFLDMRDSFCETHVNLPAPLKLMVNCLAPMIAGYHYWSCICPRYHSSQKPSTSADLGNAVSENRLDDSRTLLYPLPTFLAKRLCAAGSDGENPSPASNVSIPDRTPLEAPINYIQSLSSKNVRLQLIDAFNLWLGLPSQSLKIVKEIVSDLHNSSLILDDIQDGSLLRRGGTAAHIIFGKAQSMNSATYMFVRAAKQVHELANPSLMTVLLEELDTLFLGQSWELKWRFSGQCPSEEEYFAMVDCKTGAMFHMLIRLMLAEGKFSYLVVRCCADPVYKDIITGFCIGEVRQRSRDYRLKARCRF
ncbi:isoprenoid synthase domain-containing protein [Aspergillus keveii]|uniref:Isoprenoid synthase domain-containing protein n=1 Tax=Aspergillus keveii TaxID=714993 RepID=A0ABR4G407_9EURO